MPAPRISIQPVPLQTPSRSPLGRVPEPPQRKHETSTWTLGSVVGAVFGDALGDTHRLGLDAIYPVFFLSLLITELRDATSRWVAVCGGLLALALVPMSPPGVPVLAASTVTLIGVVRRSG